MKNFKIYNILKDKILLLLTGFALVFASCEQEDVGGPPVINNIRPTEVDSTVERAELGTWIAIQGNKLGSVQEIYFNNILADLNPTYVTNNNIVVQVPEQFPDSITGTVRVVSDFGEATHNFETSLPQPAISGMSNEYAAAGMETTIQGKFLFDIEKVIFPGQVEGTILNNDSASVTVEVPEGAKKGRLIIQNVAGSDTSDFIFRDDSHIILNYDEMTASWGECETLGPEDNPEPPTLSGKYQWMQMDEMPTGYWWANDLVKAKDNMEWTGTASDYVLKFEMNVYEELEAGALSFHFRTESDATINNYNYNPWEGSTPWKTEGWKTQSIPLEEVLNNGPGYELSQVWRVMVLFINPSSENTTPVAVALDNIRLAKATD